jgi:hypothetical protein
MTLPSLGSVLAIMGGCLLKSDIENGFRKGVIS